RRPPSASTTSCSPGRTSSPSSRFPLLRKLVGARLAGTNRAVESSLAAVSEPVWRPGPEVVERANATRVLRRAGRGDWWELVRDSASDPDWFWPLVIEDMGVEFSRPWARVLDESRGPEWATWFRGGELSIARNCVHRWAERAPDAVAAVGLGEDGS